MTFCNQIKIIFVIKFNSTHIGTFHTDDMCLHDIIFNKDINLHNREQQKLVRSPDLNSVTTLSITPACVYIHEKEIIIHNNLRE